MFYVISYLFAIVAANLTIARLGADAAPWCGGLFVGFDLTARDGLHDVWRHERLWTKMALLIGAGSVLSWALNHNAGRIALASFAAFALAGAADALLYHRLRDRPRFQRVNGSNLLASAVDSLVFPVAAFGFPVLWSICVKQFGAKVLGGMLWTWILFNLLPKIARHKMIDSDGMPVI